MRMWWNWEAMRAPPVADLGDAAAQIYKCITEYADVVELVDSLDLGSNARACRFESCHPHQVKKRGNSLSFLLNEGKGLEPN